MIAEKTLCFTEFFIYLFFFDIGFPSSVGRSP